MNAGHRSGNNLVLCTEYFTFLEVQLLISVLNSKFGLEVTVQKLYRKGNFKGYRILISDNAKNKLKLYSLVYPYFIPSMLYKLN
jgi:hypothetical protein